MTRPFTSLRTVLFVSLLLPVAIVAAAENRAAPERQLVAVEGKGYLETIDGYRVLHLKGSPDEMGYQHGVLMREAIAKNIDTLLSDRDGESERVGERNLTRTMVAALLNKTFAERVPERFMQEMKGLARGAQLPEWKVTAANLIPEMFHCSGFALLSKATAEGKLYHGRVLDYGVDQHLQDHAVLIIQEPDGRIPFVNVSYAGFIGSVTGMNLKQVSIGEMGGGGVGKWDGIPMSFLVRMVLEEAATLDEAIGVFQDNPRTCEYYYVIADAKSDSAVGMKAVPEKIDLVKPGEKYELLPKPVPDTVLMSAGERYDNLTRQVAERHGKFDQEKAIRIMDAPVAMRSNLHNALMVPADGIIWVANADQDGNPAWKQTYHRFDIQALMKTRPSEKRAVAAGTR